MNKEDKKNLKKLILELIKEHTDSCNGKDCDISFLIFRRYLEKLGLKFTKKEKASYYIKNP